MASTFTLLQCDPDGKPLGKLEPMPDALIERVSKAPTSIDASATSRLG